MNEPNTYKGGGSLFASRESSLTFGRNGVGVANIVSDDGGVSSVRMTWDQLGEVLAGRPVVWVAMHQQEPGQFIVSWDEKPGEACACLLWSGDLADVIEEYGERIHLN